MSRRQMKNPQPISEMKEGDEVITSGGIIGIIDKVAEDRVWLEISPHVIVEVLKTHITKVNIAAAESLAVEDPKTQDENADKASEKE